LNGAWYRVVIRRVPSPYMVAWQADERIRQQALLFLQTAVTKLKEAKFVHGDLRHSNILILFDQNNLVTGATYTPLTHIQTYSNDFPVTNSLLDHFVTFLLS
jgi:hypothetical protein